MFRSAHCRPRLSLLSVVVMSALAVGCGGGGEDGGGATPTASTPPSSITADNASATAAQAYLVVSTLSGAGELARELPVAAKSPDNRIAPSFTRVASNGLRHAAAFVVGRPASIAPALATSTKALLSESLSCAGGGSMSLSLNDRDDNGEVSSGDSIILAFNHCSEDGVLMNGSMRLTDFDATLAAGGESGSARASITFDNLSQSSGAVTETATGGFAMQLRWNDSPYGYELSLSGDSFRVTGPDGIDELAAFRYQESGSYTGYRFTVDATLRGALGEHRLATSTALTGSYGAYPTSGALVVTAADNSRLTLTAQSASAVRLDVDSNGDGQVESTRQLSWQELAALAD